MKISDIAQNTESAVFVSWNAGIRVKLRYMSKQSVSKLLTSCMAWEWNKNTKQREQKLNMERFISEFSERTVLGWEMTLRQLNEVVLLDPALLVGKNMEEAVEFTKDNLEFMLKNAHGFDGFVQDQSVDISNFRPDLEDELKNSVPSPSGS